MEQIQFIYKSLPFVLSNCGVSGLLYTISHVWKLMTTFGPGNDPWRLQTPVESDSYEVFSALCIMQECENMSIQHMRNNKCK